MSNEFAAGYTMCMHFYASFRRLFRRNFHAALATADWRSQQQQKWWATKNLITGNINQSKHCLKGFKNTW